MNTQEISRKTNYKIIYYEKIPSTHIWVKENYKKIQNDTIVIAKTQTKAIGTKNRKWYTGEGKNIAMTILKKPMCNIKNLENITIKIAQKIQEIISSNYKIVLQIKEPNDLILNGKKVCGILTEANTQKDIVNTLIISIGFNVNEEEFNEETRELATSLKKETNREFNIEEIIIDIINSITSIKLTN